MGRQMRRETGQCSCSVVPSFVCLCTNQKRSRYSLVVESFKSNALNGQFKGMVKLVFGAVNVISGMYRCF